MQAWASEKFYRRCEDYCENCTSLKRQINFTVEIITGSCGRFLKKTFASRACFFLKDIGRFLKDLFLKAIFKDLFLTNLT